LEDTIGISEAISPSRVVKGSQRVHEARSKATETTITKSRIDLRLDHVLHVKAELLDTL
jgi:hypothetical protein